MSTAKMPELLGMDAVALSKRIKAKEVSCREVMDAFLNHIDRINPVVNAIVSLQDRETLLRQSEERDAQLARGEYLGWLHGFPQAVKDLTATKGILTTQGSPLLKNFVPQADAFLVERMKKSGAIIIGKTNTPEFGLGSQTYNNVFGTTFNAYDQKKTAGGSSGAPRSAWLYVCRLLPTAQIFSALCETRRRSTMCLGCDPLMAAFRRDPLKKSLLGSFQFLDRSGAQ